MKSRSHKYTRHKYSRRKALRKDLTIPMNSGIAPELAGFRLRLNRGRKESKTIYPAKALRRKAEMKENEIDADC